MWDPVIQRSFTKGEARACSHARAVGSPGWAKSLTRSRLRQRLVSRTRKSGVGLVDQAAGQITALSKPSRGRDLLMQHSTASQRKIATSQTETSCQPDCRRRPTR